MLLILLFRSRLQTIRTNNEFISNYLIFVDNISIKKDDLFRWWTSGRH